jgi:DNA-binding LacI/PurR family transcriptional regulator
MNRRIKTTSITEVAELAGVSIQTVSNVLNAPERVRPGTRAHVMQAVKKLDYTPNLAARRLRSNKSSSIAVRIDSNSMTDETPRGLYPGYIQDEFVYQLVEAADQRGIKMVAYTAESPVAEVAKLKRLLKSKDVDGLILTSTMENDPRLKLLESMTVPFLSFGRPWGAHNLNRTSNPWVDIDGSWGTSLATRKFWDKGRRNIGFVGWYSPHFNGLEPQSVSEDRYIGWIAAMKELRSDFRAESIKRMSALGEEAVESGRRNFRKLIQKFPEMDAVVCASDTLALGCLLEMQEMNVKGLDLSGFDNSPLSKEFSFSSLDQDLGLVARKSLEVLMGRSGNQIRNIDFSNEPSQAHILLNPVWVERDSN